MFKIKIDLLTSFDYLQRLMWKQLWTTSPEKVSITFLKFAQTGIVPLHKYRG